MKQRQCSLLKESSYSLYVFEEEVDYASFQGTDMLCPIFFFDEPFDGQEEETVFKIVDVDYF